MSPPPVQLIREQQDPLHKYSEQTEPKQIQSKLDVTQQKHHHHHQQQQQQHQPKLTNSLIIRNKPKLAKCMSIVHLFGNAYSTQQYAARHKDTDMTTNGTGRAVHAARDHPAKSKLERFKHRSESQMDGKANATDAGVDVVDHAPPAKPLPIEDFCDDKDLGARAFRTISKRLGMIWRRSNSVEISTPDPEYKVFYLGNVLTGWAKGENCVEKPLATLWRNYAQINKPDVMMRVLVCPSGLKATTRQHGLTEYWSNRITYCCSPKNYPRVFCWVYRHEGRKLKHELRCHAVLCTKDTVAEQICKTLKENLSQALKEFKRDKISKQNARLSLVNSLYENPSMPRRKILLSVGANNYRPPMERSKSAPKLMSIEEAVGEEDDAAANGQARRHHTESVRSSTEYGLAAHRRHYRRNRTSAPLLPTDCDNTQISHTPNQWSRSISADATSATIYPDEYDEFNSLFTADAYETGTSLSNEILSYFDIKLKLDKSNETQLEPGDCVFASKHPNALDDHSLHEQAIDHDADCDRIEADGSRIMASHGLAGERTSILDSDEGSITSGCETLSVVTTTHCDDLLKADRDGGASAALASINGSIDGGGLDGDEDDAGGQRAVKSCLRSTLAECDAGGIERSVANESRTSTSTNEEESEFSDESGFDENNVCRTNGFSAVRGGSGGAGANISCGLDKRNTDANNNNTRNGFDSNIKTMRRMKINIPKNARSIHI